jgi:hypothetical protein
MRESPSQDNPTSPWSGHQNSLWRRQPMVTLCSKHKNDPLSGVDRAKKASYMAKADHACYCMARFRQYCEQLPVSRLVFRGPRNSKTKLANDSERTRTVLYTFHFIPPAISILYALCEMLCAYESVTPKPSSWGSLIIVKLLQDIQFMLQYHILKI